MKSMVTAAVAMTMLLGAASGALAQRDADRADRGQRLDSDAFRNDMLQRQLKPAPQQPVRKPVDQTTGDGKARRTQPKSKTN